MVTKATGQEEDESKAVEFGISHCAHPHAGATTEYSLGINIQDCHIDVSTSHYDHTIGYYAKFTIFNLQPSDINALGLALIIEALKIEMGEKVETPA